MTSQHVNSGKENGQKEGKVSSGDWAVKEKRETEGFIRPRRIIKLEVSKSSPTIKTNRRKPLKKQESSILKEVEPLNLEFYIIPYLLQ